MKGTPSAVVILATCVAVSAGPWDEGATQRLVAVAARGDDARLTALLAVGADPNGRDEDSRPALLLAVASGRAKAVEALLRGGADPDAATRSGWTSLHEAAQREDLAAARALLGAGAAPDLEDRTRGTPLDVAERRGGSRLARLLRRAGARGSGESIGDIVCVRPWGGDGYCGEVVDRDATRHRLRVTEVLGCASGCQPRGGCSAGRGVGPGGLAENETLWVPTSCLTDTGLR